MKKVTIAILLATVLVLSTVGMASAITDGELDGDGHPHVGLLIFDIGGVPQWRCSGTLLSPTVLLTAGHCTFGATSGRVWFESDVQQPGLGYPSGGATSVEFCGIYTHPEYDDNAFFLHDVGVVELCEAVDVDTYGTLPSVDQLDALKTGKKTTFTSVGYGLQKINPVFVEAQRVRMVATPHLIMSNVPGFTGDFSLMLSNNHSTGGTCFGDSGGPNFLGNSNVVAGVTSFAINGNCAGTGGVFRMDRQNVLDFVNQFLD
ncbi:MAG: trypsin-like serine protease [Anaerolineales bacterium]|jgi:secreted trypsin-like serine protease|nr:trypsin-like serine protease [Anaerolineales bacterium]